MEFFGRTVTGAESVRERVEPGWPGLAQSAPAARFCLHIPRHALTIFARSRARPARVTA